MAFTYNQISTLLNTLVRDVTGQESSLAVRDTSSFVAAAETVARLGYDPIMNSISQVIGRTIMSVRPYNGFTRLLERDSLTYGNAVRKITPIFTDGAQEQLMYDYTPADGQSVDHYIIKRPKAVETRFADFVQWEVQAPTVHLDQLKSAFRSAQELSDFMAAQTTAAFNEMTSEKDALALNTIANFIGAKIARGGKNVIHLLTEYNNLTGQTLTAEDIYKPANFAPFIQWMYSRIADIAALMEIRSVAFHEELTGKVIMRHTPNEALNILMYSPILKQIKTLVLAGLYHNNLLSFEKAVADIPYWQSMADRTTIKVKASYTAADGGIETQEVTATNIIGLMYDREAMGVNINFEGSNTTPINARSRYYNTFYHFVRRYYNDITENAVVLALD